MIWLFQNLEKQVVGEGIDLGGFNPFKRHSEGANVLTSNLIFYYCFFIISKLFDYIKLIRCD